MNCSFTADVTKGYTKNGPVRISVLTDEEFFGGSLNDLVKARVNEYSHFEKRFYH